MTTQSNLLELIDQLRKENFSHMYIATQGTPVGNFLDRIFSILLECQEALETYPGDQTLPGVIIEVVATVQNLQKYWESEGVTSPRLEISDQEWEMLLFRIGEEKMRWWEANESPLSLFWYGVLVRCHASYQLARGYPSNHSWLLYELLSQVIFLQRRSTVHIPQT